MADPLWTIPEIAAALETSPTGSPAIPVSGVSIDSRTLKRGDLFFAIKGERMDGHRFARLPSIGALPPPSWNRVSRRHSSSALSRARYAGSAECAGDGNREAGPTRASSP